MTYHTRIVKSVLDKPQKFDNGISGVVLDGEHTLVFKSDHNSDATTVNNELDAFVSGFETVDSHPDADSVNAQIGLGDEPIDTL